NAASIRGNGNDSAALSNNFFTTGDGDTFHLVNTNVNSHFSSKVKDLALLTARLGLTSGPQDRTLWYVKGGGAWAKTNYTLNTRTNTIETIFDTGGCAPGQCGTFVTNTFNSFQQSRSRWGWTVGTGVEFGLWDNWSTRIEYDYLHFSGGNNDNNFNFNS